MDHHTIGHVWAVIKNLITLLFILAVFDYLYEPFEVIVFSALLMIYLQVTNFMMTWGKGTLELMFGTAEEFQRLRELISKKNDDDTSITDQMKATRYMHTRYWINAGFMAVFWLIALYNLVFTVW